MWVYQSFAAIMVFTNVISQGLNTLWYGLILKQAFRILKRTLGYQVEKKVYSGDAEAEAKKKKAA